MPVLRVQPCNSKGLNCPFSHFFWGPSLIATRDSRNGVVWRKHWALPGNKRVKTSPCNKSQGLVVSCELATSHCRDATSCRDQSHHVNCFKIYLQGPTLVPATSPTNSFVGLVFWSLWLDFAAKMASSDDATSPCDLLQGIVAGTSPIVCADFQATVPPTRK